MGKKKKNKTKQTEDNNSLSKATAFTTANLEKQLIDILQRGSLNIMHEPDKINLKKLLKSVNAKNESIWNLHAANPSKAESEIEANNIKANNSFEAYKKNPQTIQGKDYLSLLETNFLHCQCIEESILRVAINNNVIGKKLYTEAAKITLRSAVLLYDSAYPHNALTYGHKALGYVYQIAEPEPEENAQLYYTILFYLRFQRHFRFTEAEPFPLMLLCRDTYLYYQTQEKWLQQAECMTNLGLLYLYQAGKFSEFLTNRNKNKQQLTDKLLDKAYECLLIAYISFVKHNKVTNPNEFPRHTIIDLVEIINGLIKIAGFQLDIEKNSSLLRKRSVCEKIVNYLNLIDQCLAFLDDNYLSDDAPERTSPKQPRIDDKVKNLFIDIKSILDKLTAVYQREIDNFYAEEKSVVLPQIEEPKSNEQKKSDVKKESKEKLTQKESSSQERFKGMADIINKFKYSKDYSFVIDSLTKKKKKYLDHIPYDNLNTLDLQLLFILTKAHYHQGAKHARQADLIKCFKDKKKDIRDELTNMEQAIKQSQSAIEYCKKLITYCNNENIQLIADSFNVRVDLDEILANTTVLLKQATSTIASVHQHFYFYTSNKERIKKNLIESGKWFQIKKPDNLDFNESDLIRQCNNGLNKTKEILAELDDPSIEKNLFLDKETEEEVSSEISDKISQEEPIIKPEVRPHTKLYEEMISKAPDELSTDANDENKIQQEESLEMPLKVLSEIGFFHPVKREDQTGSLYPVLKINRLKEDGKLEGEFYTLEHAKFYPDREIEKSAAKTTSFFSTSRQDFFTPLEGRPRRRSDPPPYKPTNLLEDEIPKHESGKEEEESAESTEKLKS